MDEIKSALGGVLIVVVGLAFAGFGGYMWLEQGQRIDTFEPTNATVVASEVGISEPTDANEGPTYYPDITYEYTVDGQEHQSSNVLPGPGRTSKDQGWARKIVQNHQKGETVTAYVSPKDPTQAFLLKRQEMMLLLFAAIGGLVALAGLGSIGKSALELVS